MKKYIISILLVISIIFISGFNLVYADSNVSSSMTGSFQLMDFPPASPIQAILYQNYSLTINFLYSGQGVEEASIIGLNLPDGMQQSSVLYGTNGLDRFIFSGTPTTPGDYPLSLVLTDNNGTMLTKPFDFKVVSPVTFTTTSLPDVIAGQPYSATINFSYVGNYQPNIIGYNLPSGLTLGSTNISSQGNGSVTLTGTLPSYSSLGKVTIGLAGQLSNKTTDTTNISFYVDKQQTSQPTIQQVSVVQPESVATPPVVITPIVKPTNPSNKSNVESTPKVTVKISTQTKSVPTTQAILQTSSASTNTAAQTPVSKHQHWYDWLNPFSWF